MDSKQAPRRRHGAELKAKVVEACREPGACVAAVALAHGLNANLVHKWRRGVGAPAATVALSDAAAPGFVPVSMPPAAASSAPQMPQAPGEIRIALERGATRVSVCWPASAGAECAVWLRELLR